MKISVHLKLDCVKTGGSFARFLVFCGPVLGVKWETQEVVMEE